MNRRDFLKLFGGVAVAGAVPAVLERIEPRLPERFKVTMMPDVAKRNFERQELALCRAFTRDEAAKDYAERVRRANEAAFDRFLDQTYYALCRKPGETDHAFRQRIRGFTKAVETACDTCLGAGVIV